MLSRPRMRSDAFFFSGRLRSRQAPKDAILRWRRPPRRHATARTPPDSNGPPRKPPHTTSPVASWQIAFRRPGACLACVLFAGRPRSLPTQKNASCACSRQPTSEARAHTRLEPTTAPPHAHNHRPTNTHQTPRTTNQPISPETGVAGVGLSRPQHLPSSPSHTTSNTTKTLTLSTITTKMHSKHTFGTEFACTTPPFFCVVWLLLWL